MSDVVTLRVEPQAPMPKIGTWMKVDSEWSGMSYKFLPKRIIEIRWHKDGSVIVDVAGTKQPWNGGDSDD